VTALTAIAGLPPQLLPSEADLRSEVQRNVAARKAAGLPRDLAELVGLLDTFREHGLGCLEERCPCQLLAGDLDIVVRPHQQVSK